ncbi:MAG: DUF6773 family protein [Candidatus Brocadiia bacterium]
MQDERIQNTINRIAARGYFILFISMMISLYYRQFILKQHVREYWDILAIFALGSFYTFIAFAMNGGLDYGFKRRWLGVSIGVIIGCFAGQFIMGQMHSVVGMAAFLLGVLPGLGIAIGIAFFLNRRWKRKEGIEDEK